MKNSTTKADIETELKGIKLDYGMPAGAFKQATERKQALEQALKLYETYALLLKLDVRKLAHNMRGLKQGVICLHGDVNNICICNKGKWTEDWRGKTIDDDVDDVYDIWCTEHGGRETVAYIGNIIDDVKGAQERLGTTLVEFAAVLKVLQKYA